MTPMISTARPSSGGGAAAIDANEEIGALVDHLARQQVPQILVQLLDRR
jgi:hypothetical protein